MTKLGDIGKTFAWKETLVADLEVQVELTQKRRGRRPPRRRKHYKGRQGGLKGQAFFEKCSASQGQQTVNSNFSKVR